LRLRRDPFACRQLFCSRLVGCVHSIL
jgi:hypothetical protein